MPTKRKRGGRRPLASARSVGVRRTLAKKGVKSGNGRRYASRVSMPSARYGRKVTNRSRPVRGTGAKPRNRNRPDAPPVRVNLDKQEKRDWLRSFKEWIPAIGDGVRGTVGLLKDTKVLSTTAKALGYKKHAKRFAKAGWGKKRGGCKSCTTGGRTKAGTIRDGRKYKRGGMSLLRFRRVGAGSSVAGRRAVRGRGFFGSIGRAFKKAGNFVADPYVRMVKNPKQFFSKPSNWLSIAPIPGMYGPAGNLALMGAKAGVSAGLRKAGLGRRSQRGRGDKLPHTLPHAGNPRRLSMLGNFMNKLGPPMCSLGINPSCHPDGTLRRRW